MFKKLLLSALMALSPTLVLAQATTWPPPAGSIAFLCVYNTVAPVLTDGQITFAQCDINGQVKTTGGGGGGGGGGAVTIADGADVAEGATADAAVASGAAGTVSAKLRLVTTQLSTLATALSTINTTLGTPLQTGGTVAVTQSTSPWVVSGAVTTTLGAGTAIIGNVRIDQTTPGTTNGVVVNSSALPSGASTSALQSTINTTLGSPFQAGGSIGNTTFAATQGTAANLNATVVGTGTLAVQAQPTPVTTGGVSVYFVQPTASDNHVVIKAGAGQVYKIMVTNNSATVNYIRLYNATTGFNGCNSASNIVYQAAIPASTTVGGLADSWDLGMAFALGISICVTSGYATTDTTNATASAMSVNIGYK